MVEQCDISILGVDLDDEILLDAKKKETDLLTFMKHDVTQPFPTTRTYDFVYSRNLLHYFNKMCNLCIGEHNQRISVSDHVPLSLSINS